MVAVPRQHTHAGVTYPAGTLVDLPEADVQWLVNAHKTSLEALLAASAPPVVPVAPEPEKFAPKRSRFFADEAE